MRLQWFRTSTNRADDFTAADPERPQAHCRVYRTSSDPGAWHWNVSDGGRCLVEGNEDTSGSATARAEEAYARLLGTASKLHAFHDRPVVTELSATQAGRPLRPRAHVAVGLLARMRAAERDGDA